MPTTLRILGWRAAGLRCPDHEIDCRGTDGKTASVSLIQMPNGTGKTTTLTLLRAALSGAARTWNPAEIRELRKKGSDTEHGTFELRLALNDRPLTIIMEFTLDTGDVQYKTTWAAGQETGFRPPPSLIRFMSEDFVNFFIFDGELASHLLSKEHTHAEEAVESLFRTNLLRTLSDKVSAYWDAQTRHVTAKDQAGHTRRTNQRDRWRRRLSDLRHTKNTLETELEEIADDVERATRMYNKEVEKDKDREKALKEAEDHVAQLKSSVQRGAAALLDEMREPHSLSVEFARAMLTLKTGLDHAKLPEGAAREFFEELADGEECVCGRPIDDTVRGHIRQRASQYLGTDDIGVLNAMKTDISDVVGESSVAAYQALTGKVDALSETVATSYTAQNTLDAIRHRAEHSDADLGRLGEEIAVLRGRKAKIESALEKFDGKDSAVQLDRIDRIDVTKIYAIDTIKEGIEKLERRVEEVAMTIDLGTKRDILQTILLTAREQAKRSIAEEICVETNERVDELLPHNDIRVEKIDGSLTLKGQSGGSVGETLSVGYAFLSTLFDRSDEHQLPFVVDSPANPIDLDIRPRIGELVPRLTGQFIAFMISSERERFLPSLVEAGASGVQFVTLFRKGASQHEARALASAGCSTTEDGILVRDEQFFGEFQLEEQE